MAAAMAEGRFFFWQFCTTQAMISSSVMASKSGSSRERLRSMLRSQSSKRASSSERAGRAAAVEESLPVPIPSSSRPRAAMTRAVPSTVRKPMMRQKAKSGIGWSTVIRPLSAAWTMPVPRGEDVTMMRIEAVERTLAQCRHRISPCTSWASALIAGAWTRMRFATGTS